MTAIYLSGPMKGLDELNRWAFDATRTYFRDLGYEVICPSENSWRGNIPMNQENRHLHLRRDVADVLRSDYVAALPGWENSEGARLETAIALELHIPVMKMEEFREWDKMPLLTWEEHPWYSPLIHPSIDRFAQEYDAWVSANFPNTGNGTQSMVGVGEEVGELGEQLLAAMSFIDVVTALGRLDHAHLKGEQGIRHTPEEIREMKIDAVGDIQVYLQGYTLREGLPNIGVCLARAWGEVRQRNWKANPTDGTEPHNTQGPCAFCHREISNNTSALVKEMDDGSVKRFCNEPCLQTYHLEETRRARA